MGRKFRFRAAMLDLARVTERKEYYESLLPWLAEWGYNVLHLHLTDDQRCALAFPRRPELATPGAFTADEMRAFVRKAAACGLGVMPEIECLGHARYIIEQARYKHLAEPPADAGPDAAGFNALCPSHPETRAILTDLLRDAAEIFDYPVIHVGLDEVKFGPCPRCRRRFGSGVSDAGRFGAHAKWLHAAVRRVGRRPAMWADKTGRLEAVQRTFSKDVLLMVAHYIPEYSMKMAAEAIGQGFEIVCCPSSVCYLTRLAPNASNLSNLRTAAARALALNKEAVAGLDNTVWCPWRYLPGALDFALALGGHLTAAGGEDRRFAERFARSFYGLAAADACAVGVGLEDLSLLAFNHNATTRIVFGPDPNGNSFSREDQRLCSLAVPRLSRLISMLKRVRAGVRSNRGRYDDVVLTAECLLAVARFGAADRKGGSVPGLGRLIERVTTAWNRDRYPDDSNRFGDVRHHGNDGLLAILAKMARNDSGAQPWTGQEIG